MNDELCIRVSNRSFDPLYCQILEQTTDCIGLYLKRCRDATVDLEFLLDELLRFYCIVDRSSFNTS
jgi:hypothetical protein